MLFTTCVQALEQRLENSHVITTRHYQIESNASQEDTKLFAKHIESFHHHLSAVFEGIADADEKRDMVRYCRDRDDFLKYGRQHCPGFSEGWYGYQRDGDKTSPGEIVLMFLGTNYSVLQHETFHRFMFHAYPKLRTWPRWFDEGLADWIARGQFVQGRFTIPTRLDLTDVMRVKDAMNDSTFIPLKQFFAMQTDEWNGDKQALAYAQGYLFAAWIMQASEKPYVGLIRAFLLRLKSTHDYQQSFDATFGAVGISKLETDWINWLKKQ